MTAFFSALQFLTIWAWPRRPIRQPDEVGRSAVFFPVIGLLLGMILALLDKASEPFVSSGLSAVVLVALLAALTRGLHLDGLGDTFDGLGAGGDRERMLRIMDDSHTGAFGVVTIVLVLFLKIHALESIDINRWRALIIAPILARWAMVLLGYRSRAAKPGLGAIFLDRLGSRQLWIATIFTFISAALLLRGMALVLMGWVAFFTLASKIYFHRRLGGVTGDTFGAVGELSEASVWFFLAVGTR